MVHIREAVLMPDMPSESKSEDLKVFGSAIFRNQVVRIQFCTQMPPDVYFEEIWDVSSGHEIA